LDKIFSGETAMKVSPKERFIGGTTQPFDVQRRLIVLRMSLDILVTNGASIDRQGEIVVVPRFLIESPVPERKHPPEAVDIIFPTLRIVRCVDLLHVLHGDLRMHGEFEFIPQGNPTAHVINTVIHFDDA